MLESNHFSSIIIADTLVSKASKSAIGAIGRNMPECDLQDLLNHIHALLKKSFRIAFLGISKKNLKVPKGVDITFNAKDANEWRNDAETRAGKKLFVVVLGVVAEGRLDSLDGKNRGVLVPVTDRDLRATIREKTVGLLPTPQRKSFWSYLYRSQDQFTVHSLLQFAAQAFSVGEKSNKHDIPEVEYGSLWMLGMFPHRKLLQTEGERKVEQIARPNLELVSRLAPLEKPDLRTLSKVLGEDGGDELQKQIAKKLLAFSRNHKKGVLLKDLDFEQVVRILTPKKTPRIKAENGDDDVPPKAAPKEKILGDEAAIEDLLGSGGENLESITTVYDLDREDDDSSKDEFKIEGKTFLKKHRNGTNQIGVAVNHFISDECFGGIVFSDSAKDYVDCLKVLESGEASRLIEFKPLLESDKYSIQQIILRVMNLYGETPAKAVNDSWLKYISARKSLLEFRHALTDHPLLAICKSPRMLDACSELVSSYGEMMNAISELREFVRTKHPEIAKKLISRTIALDVIFLKYGAGSVGVAGPLHPFHLWRWIQIAKLLRAHREELAELGEDLIQKHAANPPVSSPHLLLNSFVDDIELPRDYVFIGIGSISALPLYGDPESRTAAKFRSDEIGDIASRFISMSPYSLFGLEVVAIDPPSIPDILEALLSVNRGRSRFDLIPIHLRVFKTRETPISTDEEENEMEELAGVLREVKGSIDVEPNRMSLESIIEKLSERPAHLTQIFEPGDAHSFRVGISISPTLSPLIVPRHYTYDQLEDQFDVLIQGGATPFGAYYSIFRELLNLPDGNTIGRRSGASKWIPAIAKIGKHSMWFSIIDQGIEPTLQVPEAIRLDKRSTGGRDIHTFTSHPDTIRRYVVKVIETGGLVPDSATEKRAFNLMQRLGGDTIPIVVSNASRTGQVVFQQARGLLGVLAVSAWYERESPDALVISLDSESTRRWILGANEEDGRRGDLLCIRQSKNGLNLEVIEVKARSDEQSVLSHQPSGKNGKQLDGQAIRQIDSTITILRRILPKDGTTGIDQARREILRDQLYMAVANRALSPNRRERAVQMLNQFFESGPDIISGRLFLVHVESHVPSVYPTSCATKGFSPEKNEIEIFHIIESESFTKPDDEPPSSSGPGSTPPTPHDDSPPASTNAGTKADKQSAPLKSRNESISGHGIVKEKVSARGPSPGVPGSLAVNIGKDPTGQEVSWISSENPNFGFLVTGDPGAGKSQTIRSIISEARKSNYPVMIFDFKRDYVNDADKEDYFAQENDIVVYDVVNNGLPFNPLDLIPNEDGVVQPIRQAYEIASIIQRVEGLGEKQNNAFVEALCRAYESKGLKPKAKIKAEELTASPPTFDEVLEQLKDAGDSYSESVRIRLQKFSDLGLFPSDESPTSFDEMINGGTVLLMNDSANEKLMQILAEIMLVKLHALLKRGEQPRKLRRLLVLDEAWRVAKSQRLVDLSREGRAFGVGIVIGTQNPKDMPEPLVSCLRTQLYLYNKDIENQKFIVRQLCNATSGPHAQQLMHTVSNLGQFQGYLINEQFKRGTRVNVLPYKDRK